jgi:hypothetical protein
MHTSSFDLYQEHVTGIEFYCISFKICEPKMRQLFLENAILIIKKHKLKFVSFLHHLKSKMLKITLLQALRLCTGGRPIKGVEA